MTNWYALRLTTKDVCDDGARAPRDGDFFGGGQKSQTKTETQDDFHFQEIFNVNTDVNVIVCVSRRCHANSSW